MQVFDRETKRLYYDDMHLCRTSAYIVKTGENFIELDATIAYPEGGGQEADCGVILINDRTTMRFVGAKKLFGRKIFLKDFPQINVEGIIRHLIHPEDIHLLSTVQAGDKVELRIDIERRACMTLSHTASHLVYIGVGTVRPDAIPGTIGCHIKIDSARFDFSVKQRFTAEEITQIAEVANALANRDLPVRLFPHQVEPDARYWACEEHIIPCGGTHLDTTGPVGQLVLRRKNLGTGKERITCEFPDAHIQREKYHF